MLVFIMLLTVMAINRITESTKAIENSRIMFLQPSQDIQQMQVSFGNIKLLIRSLGINTDMAAKDQVRKGIDANFTAFKSFLDSSMKTKESALSQEELDRFHMVADLLNQYQTTSMQIIEKVMLNDIASANALITSTETPLRHEIDAQLEKLSTTNYERFLASSDYALHSGNSSIIWIIFCAVIAFILLLFILSLALSALNRAFNNLSDEQTIDKSMDTQDNSTNRNDSNLLLSDLAKQISDLKVVVYDLTKLTQGRK